MPLPGSAARQSDLEGHARCLFAGMERRAVRGKNQEEKQRRDALADTIDERRDEVIQRWLAWVNADVAKSHVDPTALQDGIGEYLAKLAIALRGGDPLSAGATAVWIDIAREHAVTRVKLGFDIDQLVHEFILLRRVLTDVAEESGLRADQRQAERIADLIEAAIATSVKSYVESRDLDSRSKQARHIGFLTHELRNPLGAAMLAASQLRLSESSPQHARTLDLLDKSHERLRELIDRVLITERLEAGETEARPVEATMGELFDLALLPAREIARSKGIEFEARYDPSTRLCVDRVLFASAVQNLVDNAVKFTDDGAVTVTVDELPEAVSIHVRDTGPGISADDLSHIFEPFKRGRSEKSGTGLGLTIARRAIEAQGGSIHAESAPGAGCHFWVVLPKTPQTGRGDDGGARAVRGEGG